MLKPCEVCGVIYNSTRQNRKMCSDACREERLREHGRSNYNKHREAALSRKKEYYKENADELRRKKREWRLENPERDKEIQAKSREKHRVKRRAGDNAYRKHLRDEAAGEIKALKETLDAIELKHSNRDLIQDLVDHISERRELVEALDYYWLGAAVEFLEDE